MMFMLVETREPFDEGERSSPEPWLVALLGWLLPWPALILWLCVASRMLDGWAGVVSVFVAIGLTAWRGLRALPAGTLGIWRDETHPSCTANSTPGSTARPTASMVTTGGAAAPHCC